MTNQAITLSHPTRSLTGTVSLTGSKSESNRALIIQALGRGNVNINNLSEAADTVTLRQALVTVAAAESDTETRIDIGPAGTAMRFLTAYLTLTSKDGSYHLTGSERMKQRPIGILVDALSTLGANIQYAGQPGYPPLTIHGGLNQRTTTVKIKGDVSSQYLSALLLVASALPNGLRLQIEGELTSRPYLSMTLNMLAEAGIAHSWENNTITISPQQIQPCELTIEPDWSAASYWYAMVALAEKADLLLPNLKPQSLQGDAAITSIMEQFGVISTFQKEGLRIRKASFDGNAITGPLDFTECPDLAQTVIVCAAAQRRNLSFTGLHTLRIKETDRVAALQRELAKIGVQLVEDGTVYHLRTEAMFRPATLAIDTYEDHRMAMAFAPLALLFNNMQINDPAVVEKSYPDFWKHLKQHGFVIS